jgi:hypothetical protein
MRSSQMWPAPKDDLDCGGLRIGLQRDVHHQHAPSKPLQRGLGRQQNLQQWVQRGENQLCRADCGESL